MKYTSVTQKTVLVTGCSSGIGAATAHYLRDHGWTVFPTARKDDDLNQLKADGFNPIRLDLTDSQSVREAVNSVKEQTEGQLGALVNNAGFAQAGVLEDVNRDALRAQFEVNVFGMQELTNQCIPLFRHQRYGRIVNVSSVLGRIVSPMVGSYCASKFAMEALSDTLRVELRGTGIAVSIIEPGPIISEFRRNAARASTQSIDVEKARYGELYQKEAARREKQVKKPDLFTRPPEEVAKKIYHALESTRPHRRYCVTIPAYLGAWAARWLPTALIDKALYAGFSKQAK